MGKELYGWRKRPIRRLVEGKAKPHDHSPNRRNLSMVIAPSPSIPVHTHNN
jgi:hypothetical protein